MCPGNRFQSPGIPSSASDRLEQRPLEDPMSTLPFCIVTELPCLAGHLATQTKATLPSSLTAPRGWETPC